MTLLLTISEMFEITRALNDAVFEASKSCVGTAVNAYRSRAATAPPHDRATVPARKKVAPR